jgi:hypothetical protein
MLRRRAWTLRTPRAGLHDVDFGTLLLRLRNTFTPRSVRPGRCEQGLMSYCRPVCRFRHVAASRTSSSV